MSYDLHGEREQPLEDLEPLITALRAVDPAADRFDGDSFVEIDSEGVQVNVAAGDCAVTVPYHFAGKNADAVMAQAYAYAGVLTRVGGFRMWDPQLETVVGDDSDPAAAGAMLGMTSHVAGEWSDATVSPRVEGAVGWAITLIVVALVAFVIYGFAEGFDGGTVAKALFTGFLIATVAMLPLPSRRRRHR